MILMKAFAWITCWPMLLAGRFSESEHYDVENEAEMIGSILLAFVLQVVWWLILFQTVGHFLICKVFLTCVYQ